MWEIETSEQWDKDRRFYEKKHPRELAAVLRNLDRYLKMLEQAPNAKAVQAGFLHPEPAGVLAIDQKGGGGNLQETRLYTYAESAEKVVHLITIGNKSQQSDDILFAKEFVRNITNLEEKGHDHSPKTEE